MPWKCGGKRNGASDVICNNNDSGTRHRGGRGNVTDNGNTIDRTQHNNACNNRCRGCGGGNGGDIGCGQRLMRHTHIMPRCYRQTR